MAPRGVLGYLAPTHEVQCFCWRISVFPILQGLMYWDAFSLGKVLTSLATEQCFDPVLASKAFPRRTVHYSTRPYAKMGIQTKNKKPYFIQWEDFVSPAKLDNTPKRVTR